ncbi:allophanate hydrolase [Paenibacillus daejeonensis]|uniref:allophanate hydrolase n=1 Tax=Paenibacillus daejeonensis TaxID=135193 RepID=UPI00037EC39B|nr:allophanate hydrolase [Paenibacillus daejeonensis]
MSVEAYEIPELLSVEELREAYRKGVTTPGAVIQEIIRRAEADGAMNLWITPPSLERIQPYLDRLAKTGQDLERLPLWGIPFAIKDNIDLAGVPTTAACEEFAYTPSEDAVVVARLIAAGAIPVGKTNLDQFATGLVGVRSPYGEAHNALRPELISGGSSSGSAVAVARGQACFSLGTDTAGSGRVPAALHGLVGYKPTLGAWPTKGVVPACESLDCVNVFAGSLDDALVVDAALRGLEVSDPWSREMPRSASSLPKRLVLPDGPLEFYGPFAAEYRQAWESAVARVEDMDVPVVYVSYELFSEAAKLLYEGPYVAERWAGLGDFVEAHPGVTFPVTEQILRSGAAPQHTAASLFQAMHKLQRYKQEARELLQDGVLVMPTCGGTWTRDEVRAEPVAANSAMGKYTNHCNLLDLCGVAIPAGLAGERLPFGITLFALAESEHLICGTAERFLEAGGSAGALYTDAAVRGVGVVGVSSKSGGGASAASVGAEGSQNSAVPSAEQRSEAVVGAVSTAGAGVPAEVKSGPGGTTAAMTQVAVCGLHMRGLPLEKQMLEHGARFLREAQTAPRYRLFKLATVPAKPGLVKQSQGGVPIALEVWEMPLERFGSFAALIPAPLGIGKVELEDGTEVPGFICEGYAAAGGLGKPEDVSHFGGWRRMLAASAETVEK